MRIQMIIFLLALAVGSDLLRRKIPNKLVVIGMLTALVTAIIEPWLPDGSSQANMDWTTCLAGTGAGLLSLMPLYLMRACGAGDVKLMAMVGAFVGPTTVLYAALYTLIAGGVLSLVYMLAKGVAAQTLRNVQFLLTDLFVRAASGSSVRLDPLATTAARLPYAVAIAAGTGMALLQRAGIV